MADPRHTGPLTIACAVLFISIATDALPQGATAAFEQELAARKSAIAEMSCTLDDKPCLTHELDARYELDQWLRRQLDVQCAGAERSTGESCWHDMFVNYILPVDKANLARVIAIYDRHGWPHGEGWTKDAENAIWFVVQHNPDTERDLMGEILPHVKAAAEAGRLTGWHYAAMYDRRELFAGRKQYYGTQFRCENGVIVPQDMLEPDTVDTRRAELGMETVAEKAASMGSC